MQETTRDFQAELDHVATTFEVSQDYHDLRAFFDEARARGLVMKHEYGLKQADIFLLSDPQTPRLVGVSSWLGTYLDQALPSS